MTHIQTFESDLKDSGKSINTIKSYISDLAQFEKWLVGTYGEAELTPSIITKLDVAHYKTYMMTVSQRKPAGINRALSSIAAFCNWGKEKGLLQGENPTAQIPQAKQIKTPPKALEDKEFNRLMREVYKSQDKRDVAIMELMAGAGLRIGEVAALKMTDIEISERRGVVTVRQGKGAKYRQVPLNRDARKALADYLEERGSLGESLFMSQKGGALTANAMWRIVKKYGDKIGERITPHSLRHTFGTQLVRKHKIDLPTVANLMGHENISTTALYTKPNSQDLINAVEKLSKW